MFDEADRHAVLKLARDAVIAQVTGGAPPEVPPTDLFARRAGAFVTLNEHGDLRGCIGYPEADRPLGDVVIGAAVSASTADPRFPPVRPEELPHLQIEVSVLSVIEPVSDPEEIEPGRHGLVVQLGRRRGLLL